MPELSFAQLLVGAAGAILIMAALTGKSPVFIIKEAMSGSGTGAGTGGTTGTTPTGGTNPPASPPAAQYKGPK